MLCLFTIIIVFIFLIVSIKYYLNQRYQFWSGQGVPGYEGINFSQFQGLVHEMSLQNAQKYGPIYGYYEFFRKGIVVNEPELIKDIMVKDFHIFPHHRELYFAEDSINLNLFNLPGNEDWKRIRNIISPAFTSAKLKFMMDCIEDISDNFVKNLTQIIQNKSKELDIRKYIGAFLIDVITSCAYGIKTDSLNNPDQPIVTHASKIFAVEGKFSLIVSVTLPKLAKFLKLEPFSGAAIRYFRNLTNKIVNERNENSEKFLRNKKSDLIQLMIEANKNKLNDNNIDEENNSDINFKSSTNQKISTIEMTAQCVLFFVAGFDTTGSTLAHVFYYLAKYQDLQQKLYEEISSIDKYTNESLTELKYLNGIILETLRLSPPIMRIERVSVEDYILGYTGIRIPAGSVVTFCPYSLHRDHRFFEDPDQFRPQRFIGEERHNSHAFIPFGGGPRNCLGMRFAMIQMRICLAKLCKRFRFKLSPNTKLEYLKGNVFLSPKEVLLVLESRE